MRRSLRWTACVASKPSKEAQKCKVTNFRIKIDFYEISFSVGVIKHLQAYLTMHNLLMEDVLLYLKFWAKLTHPLKMTNFESILARSVSAVTLSEYKKSTTRFSMSLRWTAYVARKPQRGGGLKTQSDRFSYKSVLIM